MYSNFLCYYSSFDARQPPFRILFQREPNSVCLQIAVSDSEKHIETAWNWITANLIPELDRIEEPFAKEEWLISQMDRIMSHTIIENDTDELLHDDSIRNASRTFRRTFNVSSNERLVECMINVTCLYKI
ncbi:hypothetical protein BDB01DRAFT_717684 [Pilobolus umbonatus]|nr:hypothetical protein BDB01DRAFT_717684 [Pilobolus umbonatus]